MMRQTLSITLLCACLALSSQARAANIDWSKVDAALGKPATIKGEVHRYGIPRSDLKVTLDGVALKPALALGGWVAFQPTQDSAMVMGDLVLTEIEVNPVMTKLLQTGFEITALHNHLLRATPATFYMHIRGHGDPVKLATAIREALAESKTPFEAPEANSAETAEINLDTEKLDQVVGAKGKVSDGVYQFSIPPKDEITEKGLPVTPAMGTGTVINFQATGGGKAAIAGDFVMKGDEVILVIRALRENGIEVVAIHNHMLEEMPRLFFLHFWANDDAMRLAHGVRAALDKMARG